jgi:hypothetical protein
MKPEKVAFAEVKLGERFSTPDHKRLITCVKIAPTEVSPGQYRNAVILLDHTNSPAEDLGALLTCRDQDVMQVFR